MCFHAYGLACPACSSRNHLLNSGSVDCQSRNNPIRCIPMLQNQNISTQSDKMLLEPPEMYYLACAAIFAGTMREVCPYGLGNA